MNNKIGQVLKHYRKLNGFTVPQIAKLLNEQYGLSVAEKTVYGWESNQAHPTSDTLLIMCEVYGIHNISIMFENPPEDAPLDLNDEEKEIVLGYRKYTIYQPAIRQLLHISPKKHAAMKKKVR